MGNRLSRSLSIAVLGTALTGPIFAANPIQEAVANVPAADNVSFGASVGVRIYSIGVCASGSNTGCVGSDTGINNNTPACTNLRCIRTYTTLGGFRSPGGYPGNTEGTGAYNTDADGQTFYAIWDGQVNGGAGNHAAYFAAQGTVASSTVLPLGDFRRAACSGTLAGNCFFRADGSNSDPDPILFVPSGKDPVTIPAARSSRESRVVPASSVRTARVSPTLRRSRGSST